MMAQKDLITDPLENARTFSGFQEKFSHLQFEISKYWMTRQFEGPRGKLYCSFVSAAFQIGIHVVQWGIRKSGLDERIALALEVVIKYVAGLIEKRVTVVPAKILFEIFDFETKKVDAALSWSIDWMRKQIAWDRQELLSLLKEKHARLKVETDTITSPDVTMADVSVA